MQIIADNRQYWKEELCFSQAVLTRSSAVIGAATARVARVRTPPTFEKVKLDPPNFLGGPAQDPPNILSQIT